MTTNRTNRAAGANDNPSKPFPAQLTPFPAQIFVRQDEGANLDEIAFTADPKLSSVVEDNDTEQVIAIYKFDRTVRAKKIAEVTEA